MMINPEYAKPILTIVNALSEHNIPFTLKVCWDGLQICFPWNYGDVICHAGSYGHTEGKVETMGCPWDGEDVSTLSVEDAIKMIIAWWCVH